MGDVSFQILSLLSGLLLFWAQPPGVELARAHGNPWPSSSFQVLTVLPTMKPSWLSRTEFNKR